MSVLGRDRRSSFREARFSLAPQLADRVQGANRTAMAGDVQQPDAHIAYPTNRVVGTIGDPKKAQAAIEALLRGGFAQQDIDILHDEADLHRADLPTGERRFLAQFQRTLIHTLADEHKHLQHYVDDVRAGRSVIMVLARKRDKREAAADILGTHGAASVEFYGRWAWHALEPHLSPPIDDTLRDPTPGRTYEIALDGSAIRVRFDSESRVSILRKAAGASDIPRIPVTFLKPQVLMLTWNDSGQTTHVHVYDFETSEAHSVVNHANHSVHRAKGTLRRVD
jgi:hypothetical protein